MRRTLIAGNWKMNGLRADLSWIEALQAALDLPSLACDLAICPPATLLGGFASNLPSTVALGGQDCAVEQSGAHTGDVSAMMLADIGCRYVIIGHSERRSVHQESSEVVRCKAEAALGAGLTPIICVGETLEERDGGQAEQVVIDQLTASLPADMSKPVVIAYEPVWAIGTGRTAGPQDAQSMHATMRSVLPEAVRASTRLLYGGSVKPENAPDLLAQPDIDGALVGGASLSAEDFAAIAQAAR